MPPTPTERPKFVVRVGQLVPDGLLPLFADRQPDKALRKLAKVIKLLGEVQLSSPSGLCIQQSELIDLHQLVYRIRSVLP